MARTFSAFYSCTSILIMMLFVVLIQSSINHIDYKTFAVTNTSSSILKNKEDMFSAIGAISSLVITVPESGFNNAFKVILTGEWNLSVHKGNVTNFAANFLASPMDGTKPHIN